MVDVWYWGDDCDVYVGWICGCVDCYVGDVIVYLCCVVWWCGFVDLVFCGVYLLVGVV